MALHCHTLYTHTPCHVSANPGSALPRTPLCHRRIIIIINNNNIIILIIIIISSSSSSHIISSSSSSRIMSHKPSSLAFHCRTLPPTLPKPEALNPTPSNPTLHRTQHWRPADRSGTKGERQTVRVSYAVCGLMCVRYRVREDGDPRAG